VTDPDNIDLSPEDPPAASAAEQDHENPWAYAGDDDVEPPAPGEVPDGVA
jgi:hypothetical protein